MVLMECLLQPFLVNVNPEPRPVVLPIFEALSLRRQILRVLPGETTVILSYSSPLLEGLDVRDEDWIGSGGSAHQLPSQSGSLMPSTISRFCASLMPPE